MKTDTSVKMLGVFMTMLFVAACGSDSTEPEPTVAISVQSGSGQSGAVGVALASPIVVRVTEDGSAVAGTSVAWAVTTGGGSVTPATSVTDATGLASSVWTLGASAGANSVQASVTGATGSPVTFSATATSGTPPTQANVTVGDNFFDPSSTTIAAGGQVTWTWGGAVDHNVTFATGTNSTTQSVGTFGRTFATVGTFDYQCTIHGAAMSGTVVVQ